MAITTNGKRFKEFYADPQWWDNDSGNVYHDDTVIFVNGGKRTDVDPDLIADADDVRIENGQMTHLIDPQFDGMSLVEYFSRWEAEQQTVSFVVTCPKALEGDVMAAIHRALGEERLQDSSQRFFDQRHC